MFRIRRTQRRECLWDALLDRQMAEVRAYQIEYFPPDASLRIHVAAVPMPDQAKRCSQS
jgi:hypothetical protein